MTIAEQYAFQVAIWGFADIGHRDVSAAVSEGWNDHRTRWDDPSWLAHTLIDGGPAPAWHALPWVGEHLRRMGR